MSTDIINKALLKGAHFLLQASSEQETFTPEDFSEEQKMVAETTSQFVDQDFQPFSDRLEHGEHDLNRELLLELGNLGLLGTHMPEQYGGMEMDTNTNTIVAEKIGKTGAFSTTYGAHTGIGMLPILYFGTEEQKNKYLPDLISGEKVACYCLTEPSSGSDALAAKSKAELSEDGKHYILNGQKMWISNAGFADVFIVFAKIDGRDFTGFIVEKGWEGLSLGAEEKKLGIKGSSTRQVFFENVKVPVENLLGEKGEGHQIAFNVLNTGRYKIGPMALGGAKGVIELSANYANERVQFGQAIASFGAIQSKLAEQVLQTYAVESAVYRTSGLIQDHIAQLKEEGQSYAESKLNAAEEYALESSILKICASDNVNMVADECVQIHGGMGFSEETLAARCYRDSRIAKIYEGTNEINRMLMLNLVFKRAMKGHLDIATPALKIQQDLLSGSKSDDLDKSPEQQAVENFKKVGLMLIGSVAQLAMKGKINMKQEQEILMNLANILTDTYLAESTYLRTTKHPSTTKEAMTKVFLRGANDRIYQQALEAVGSFVLPEKQAGYVSAIRKFCSYPLVNVKELKREIAGEVIKSAGYPTF